MAAPTHRELFTGLLRELRATGPLGRLRLLGRGVGALRQLSPWDRKMLLRMAGFEGAETLIERLAAEDEETAERLQRVLAEIEREPARSEQIVRALADPQQRGEAIESLVDLLDRAHEEEEAPPPAPPAPPPQPSLPEDAPFPELAPDTGRPAAPKPPSRKVPSAPPMPRPATEVTPPGAETAKVAAAATLAAAAAAKARTEAESEAPQPFVEESPQTLTPEPPAPVEPAVAAPPPPDPGRPTADEATPAPAAPRLDDLPSLPVERGTRGMLGTLLDLRRRLEEDGSVPADEIRALLTDSGVPPWARRRAVTAWIEAGRPDADAALAMIGDLGSATDRTWCLASLAASRRWPLETWEKILEAAPDDTARRRLERRRP